MNKFLVTFYAIILFALGVCIRSCSGAIVERLRHRTFNPVITGSNPVSPFKNNRGCSVEVTHLIVDQEHAGSIPVNPVFIKRNIMEKITVNLTYFKDTGKYYSSGSFKTTHKPLYMIFEEVINMMKLGKRPGLIDGNSGFHVLIEVPEHENNHPRLLIGVA